MERDETTSTTLNIITKRHTNTEGCITTTKETQKQQMLNNYKALLFLCRASGAQGPIV